VHSRACLGPDERTLAVTDHARGRVFVLDLEDRSSTTLPEGLASAARVAVSPDCRWVAASTQSVAGGIRVWDLRRGELAKDLPTPSPGALLAFSPDGRWLAKGTAEGYALMKVGSWEVEWEVKCPTGLILPLAFSPDCALLAAAEALKIRLLNPATGDEFATLDDNKSGFASWLAFSPDGSQLAVASEGQVVRVWDLRRIRQQLAPMGLDWDLPAYPPAKEDKPPKPLTVKVVPGEP
jgi:WD40 repeat protein